MKEIKVIVAGQAFDTDVLEGDEESAQVQLTVLLVEKGTAGIIDRKTRLIVIRDGKLVLV